MTSHGQSLRERRTIAVQQFIDALSTGGGAEADAAARGVADNVVLRGIFGSASGREELLTYLKTKREFAGLESLAQYLSQFEWSAAVPPNELPPVAASHVALGSEAEEATLVVVAHHHPHNIAFKFVFDGDGPIAQIEGSIWLDALQKSELRISDEFAALLFKAPDHWRHIVVGYPTVDGQMHMGLRGSAYVYSSDQIAFWARGDGGSLARALGERPDLEIGMLFSDPENRVYCELYGRGRMVDSEEERTRIYESMPQEERTHDWEKKGRAVIIDIDRIRGISGSEVMNMERQ